MSPAQLLFGRPLRDAVPQHKSVYRITPRWRAQIREREKSMAEEKTRNKAYYDNQPTHKHHELIPGQTVACQNVKTGSGILRE